MTRFSIVKQFLIATFVLFTLNSKDCFAQLSTYPAGRNQRAEVSQWMGLVKVTVNYSSPSVKPHFGGKDRTGEVWGKLIPFGMSENPYRIGSTMPKMMPWRAGANENTTITFSHDVNAEGQKIPAGIYGFHTIPDSTEWTIIFSKNPKSWGSFFYDPAMDALRVKVKPQTAEFHNDLTYEFTERELASTTLSLVWEKLRVPIKLSVPNIADIHLAQIRLELTSGKGFGWQDYLSGVRFCLNAYKGNYDEALEWINRALECNTLWSDLVANPININFITLQTKAQVLVRLGRMREADSVATIAINHPTSTSQGITNYGAFLLAEKKRDEALKVFQKNEAKFPKEWSTHWGLAQGYSATGDLKKALNAAQLALKNVPDDEKEAVQAAIEKLKANKNFLD